MTDSVKLCAACANIFSSPRRLAYGKYYPWNQTPASFAAALEYGCHLCHLIDECRSYQQPRQPADQEQNNIVHLGNDSLVGKHTNSSRPFPLDTSYAFKALSDRWARDGKGHQWMAPQTSGVRSGRTDDAEVDDDARELAEYLRLADTDPTPNKLGNLLAVDHHLAPVEAARSWLVLEFYGPAALLALPIELETSMSPGVREQKATVI
jgi:hypothetical protein